MTSESMNHKDPIDIYRESSLRFMGYTGIFSSFCYHFIPFHIAQMVTVTYILRDVTDKARKAYQATKSKQEMIGAAGDATIWQLLSSVLIPRTLIKSLTTLTARTTCSPIGCLPCILAIIAIPFLSRPIDKSASYIMDNSYRNWLDSNLYDGNYNGKLWKYFPRRVDDIDNVYDNWKSIASNKKNSSNETNSYETDQRGSTSGSNNPKRKR